MAQLVTDVGQLHAKDSEIAHSIKEQTDKFTAALKDQAATFTETLAKLQDQMKTVGDQALAQIGERLAEKSRDTASLILKGALGALGTMGATYALTHYFTGGG